MTDIPFNRAIRFTGLTLAGVLMAACASYGTHQHAHVLALAQQDDAACVAQGWHYPTPRYVTCRMNLQDQRLHQDWLNLQLMHQTSTQPTGIPQAYPYRETYRPLNREHFSCWISHENNQDYILCDEKDDTHGARTGK